MNVLSIQSHVCYGHVGNAAAVFPLQRLGVDVWPVHTVQFSNHPGYAQWRGRVLEAEMIRELVQGIDDRGVLGECDAILSGYLGSVENGQAVLDAVDRVKRANPAARYCCDPVIGDIEQGVFVAEGILDFMRECALPAADIITPNQFELDRLTGRNSGTLRSALDAMNRLHEAGPRTVVVTSLRTDETPRGALDVLASDGEARCRVRTPLLSTVVNGAGDAIAALFLVHYLRSGSLQHALSLAVSSTYAVVCHSAEAGSRELLLVHTQDELVEPSKIFKAELV